MRNRDDLLKLAADYALVQRAPVGTIIKEILHYEILYAMQESRALSKLVFQGGTSLRLCYQGNRYSEDLDFAGGTDFDPKIMDPFSKLLQREIADAYGLAVDIKSPKPSDGDEKSGVSVLRWSARITVPNPDRSMSQKQLIKIEVASVPAYDEDFQSVIVNYRHLPAPFGQMVIPVESTTEILADKIVALGARDYFKARDVWDIKFLLDRQVVEQSAMFFVGRKLADYGWKEKTFKQALARRVEELSKPETAAKFKEEMSRFVDGTMATYLMRDTFAKKYLERSMQLANRVLLANIDVPTVAPASVR